MENNQKPEMGVLEAQTVRISANMPIQPYAINNKLNSDEFVHLSEENSMNPFVSIVYLTKNGGRLFKKSLEALFSQKVDFGFEVIAVDSGSTDGILDMMKNYPIRVYQIDPEEFNFGLMRDYGFSLARGEIIITLSQDAIPVGTGWLII